MKVDPSIEHEWVKWQKEEHIPAIMATGKFIEYRFYRLLGQDEADGLTYVVQYSTPSMDLYNNYIEQFAPALRQKAMIKWGSGFVAFRTIMQSVD
jgi:hypothetical protein